MSVAVREVLSAGAEGLDYTHYPRQMARNQLNGIDVGEKYHSREFAMEVGTSGCLLGVVSIGIQLGPIGAY
jgi:hypothetical protein